VAKLSTARNWLKAGSVGTAGDVDVAAGGAITAVMVGAGLHPLKQPPNATGKAGTVSGGEAGSSAGAAAGVGAKAAGVAAANVAAGSVLGEPGGSAIPGCDTAAMVCIAPTAGTATAAGEVCWEAPAIIPGYPTMGIAIIPLQPIGIMGMVQAMLMGIPAPMAIGIPEPMPMGKPAPIANGIPMGIPPAIIMGIIAPMPMPIGIIQPAGTKPAQPVCAPEEPSSVPTC